MVLILLVKDVFKNPALIFCSKVLSKGYLLFLLQAIFMIPTKPPPTFKDADRWSKEFLDFVSKCLVKNPEERATATQLLQVSLLVKQPALVSWTKSNRMPIESSQIHQQLVNNEG